MNLKTHKTKKKVDCYRMAIKIDQINVILGDSIFNCC
jgi:hypothetical protein